ncbi:LarC family nickel insertion protein [Ruegeria hyattellae]|uniref:LarC family nickel insertion protein n=1 Tax=Ruegeria hyattellae TaxID=3233337 RepID=UPI00355B7FD2
MKNVNVVDLDLVGGIAGDMFLSACLHAFPEFAVGLSEFLNDADLPAAYQPTFNPVVKDGLTGMYLAPVSRPERCVPSGHWTAIRSRIQDLSASAAIKAHAIGIYGLVAEAEAEVHGIDVDKVHFHELADWDTYLDVLGTAWLIDQIAPGCWTYDAAPLGGGFVTCDHGRMPVPAPATLLLLKGLRCVDDGVGGERVTPTGAAILKYLVSLGGSPAPVRSAVRVGYGAGTMSLPGIPNVLRLTAYETLQAGEPTDWRSEEIVVLSFEIDDMTQEEIATSTDHLRGIDGILDVSVGQRSGKKGRFMSDFRLLVRPGAVQAATRQCFLQTTTLGVRSETQVRQILERSQRAGEVGVKYARRPEGVMTAKAEQDHLRVAATLPERRALAAKAETEES